jgi:hypothetical protein
MMPAAVCCASWFSLLIPQVADLVGTLLQTTDTAVMQASRALAQEVHTALTRLTIRHTVEVGEVWRSCPIFQSIRVALDELRRATSEADSEGTGAGSAAIAEPPHEFIDATHMSVMAWPTRVAGSHPGQQTHEYDTLVQLLAYHGGRSADPLSRIPFRLENLVAAVDVYRRIREWLRSLDGQAYLSSAEGEELVRRQAVPCPLYRDVALG